MRNKIELLQRVPLFALLQVDVLCQLAEAAKETALGKNEVLFFRGDPSSGFYVVVTGRIKLYLDGPLGVEKIVETVGPGGTFGEAVMFLGQSYPVNAAALTPSQLLWIPKERIDELIRENPGFCHQLLAALAMRLRSLIRDIESYSICTATQRVIGYLLSLLPPDVTKLNGQEIEITLPVQKYVLASRLNLQPETLSRVFNELTQQGLLRTSGRKIWITDPKRLFMEAPEVVRGNPHRRMS